MLREIVEIARSADAWILCDEVYRHLSQEDGWCPSIVDLYEKGISVSSMSKVFSLAGLWLGWIATHDMSVVKSCLSHRDYNLVSCGVFDEMLEAVYTVGKRLPAELRETALGGCATTPSACAACHMCD